MISKYPLIMNPYSTFLSCTLNDFYGFLNHNSIQICVLHCFYFLCLILDQSSKHFFF